MRNRTAGLIGNFLEHYDQALFGFLAPFLAPLFFPDKDPLQALIYTYAMLPLGILSRPIGAILFGKLGDRIGRKKTLSITLIGMAFATGMMGFFPLFQGKFSAPLFWSGFRLLQNFFAAGETTGGAIYILENVDEKKQCFWGSLFDASGILGILTASAAVVAFSFWEISWSFLFWAGSLTAAVGAFIRFTEEETWVKKEAEKTFVILWKYRQSFFKIAAVSGFSYANYYLLSTFMNGFLPLTSSITKTEAIGMNTMLLVADFLLLPLFGLIGQKIGKERLMLGALIAALGFSFPLLGMAQGATYGTAIGIRIAFTFIGVALAAPYNAWALQACPLNHRYLIGALASAIGSRLIGSPAPAVSLWLYQQTGLAPMAALPIIATALLALFAIGRPQKQVESIDPL